VCRYNRQKAARCVYVTYGNVRNRQPRSGIGEVYQTAVGSLKACQDGN
jgi:hypothetical protein